MTTRVLRNHADFRHIQAILGHARITRTEVYTHRSLEDLKEAVHLIATAREEGKMMTMLYTMPSFPGCTPLVDGVI